MPRIAFISVAAAAALACSRDATAPTAVVTQVAMVASAHDDDKHSGKVGVDFERFTVGGIDGQFDWKSLGGTGAPPPANPGDTHCAVYDHVIADVSGSVAPKSFDERALRISNAVTTGCYGDQTFSSRSKDYAGQAGATPMHKNGLVNYSLPGGQLENHFEAEWTFASAVPDAQQPGLEVVVSPGRGDDHRMSWVIMTDLADGIAVIFAERSNPTDPGAITQTTVKRRLDRRKSHTIKLTMDFVDGPSNDVVRVSVDGELEHTGTSWETYYALDANGKANFSGNPPAVNRLMFRTGSDTHRGIPGTPAPATLGKGFYFDDVSVSVKNAKLEKNRD